MKKFLLLFASSVFLFTVSAADDVLAEAKKIYRSLDYVKQNPLVIRDGYVFVTGTARKHGSKTAAKDIAGLTASANILYIKELEIDTESFNPQLKNIYRRNLFNQYQSIANIKYSTKNMIPLVSFSEKQEFACVYACKPENIQFSPADKLSLELVYNTLKNNPQKRDELIFFEIIPENEIPALLPQIRANISRQYGENFAAMFLGEKLKPVNKKYYETGKKQIAKFTGKTKLMMLVAVANRVPYDPQLCNMLAGRFEALQMPRCAAIMRKCAGKKYTVEFIKPAEKKAPAEQPVKTVKPAVKIPVPPQAPAEQPAKTVKPAVKPQPETAPVTPTFIK